MCHILQSLFPRSHVMLEAVQVLKKNVEKCMATRLASFPDNWPLETSPIKCLLQRMVELAVEILFSKDFCCM